jgi:HD domain
MLGPRRFLPRGTRHAATMRDLPLVCSKFQNRTDDFSGRRSTLVWNGRVWEESGQRWCRDPDVAASAGTAAAGALFADETWRALRFAERAHRGHVQRDGVTPYVSHVADVARLALEAGAPVVVVCAAYLHDVVEDEGVSADEIAGHFGAAAAELVVAVSDEPQDPETGARRRWMDSEAPHRPLRPRRQRRGRAAEGRRPLREHRDVACRSRADRPRRLETLPRAPVAGGPYGGLGQRDRPEANIGAPDRRRRERLRGSCRRDGSDGAPRPPARADIACPEKPHTRGGGAA